MPECCVSQNTKAVVTLKYFITLVTFYVFIKKLYGKVLGIFLTLIPQNKIVSALK